MSFNNDLNPIAAKVFESMIATCGCCGSVECAVFINKTC